MPIFEVGTGTNGTPSNTVDTYYGPWSYNWAMGTKKTFSGPRRDGFITTDTGTQTAVNALHIYVPTMAMQIASETTPLATGRGRIWEGDGTHVASSASVSIHQDSATPLSNQTFTMNAWLNPTASYRFGFYISSGTANSRVNYDWKTTSGENIHVHTDTSASADFVEDVTQKSGAALMVDVEYYTFPDAPSLLSGSSTTSTINFSISSPADTTYSGAITGYVVQYKESSATTWITDNEFAVAGSYSIGNLTPGKSYNVRVAATNAATSAYAGKVGTLDLVTGPYVSATYSVKTFGSRFTDGSGNKSGLSTIKRFVGIGLSTVDGNGNTIAADSDGYVNLTIGKRFDGTNWNDIG